jgi:hypothetical protein
MIIFIVWLLHFDWSSKQKWYVVAKWRTTSRCWNVIFQKNSTILSFCQKWLLWEVFILLSVKRLMRQMLTSMSFMFLFLILNWFFWRICRLLLTLRRTLSMLKKRRWNQWSSCEKIKSLFLSNSIRHKMSVALFVSLNKIYNDEYIFVIFWSCDEYISIQIIVYQLCEIRNDDYCRVSFHKCSFSVIMKCKI